MSDLTTLIEKRCAYINEKADNIVRGMISRNVTTDTLATCDAPNWDRELHSAMYEIVKKLKELGIRTNYKINWGVTDWTFTVITD